MCVDYAANFSLVLHYFIDNLTLLFLFCVNSTQQIRYNDDDNDVKQCSPHWCLLERI